jgi:malate dehydrogenase (oxaloacetate-decarboxylating)(NADP+)
MKLAAVKALANLAKEEVPEDVRRAYGNENFKFGKNYLIPKPFDKRVLTRLSPAVAKAAVESGVARLELKDFKQYALDLEARLGMSASFMRNIRSRLPKKNRPRIVFAEGTNQRILHAISILIEEGLINPIILGEVHRVHARMDELGLSHLKSIEVIQPEEDDRYEEFYMDYYNHRQRKGASFNYSQEAMTRANYFGSMMVKNGYADGMITGATISYKECIKPVLRVLGTKNKQKASGIIILIFKSKVFFLADCTVQIDPTAQDLAEIAESATRLYKKLMMKEPRVGFLSFSSFGSNPCPETKKVKEAVRLTKERNPNMIVDGEMQADVAVNDTILKNLFSFSTMDKSADVLIFPNLSSSNISYKLLSQLGGATPIGPILAPMEYAVNIVQRTSTVEEIVAMSNMTALIALEAKTKD